MPDLPVAAVPWLPTGVSPLTAQPWTPSASLQSAVQTAVDRHQGSISVVVVNLQTGASASVNAEQQLSSASLYKLFLLQTAYAQMATGQLHADEQLTLAPATADADPYTDLATGTRSSLSCALQTMIEISSNSAADMVEDRLGDSTVNTYLLGIGLQQSYITPDHAYTSAADMARLLNAMAVGHAVSPQASSQMLTMLLAQQENNRLPLPLPIGISIAHKTGELPNLRHDAGVIYAPSGPYLVVAMAANAPSEAAARDTIVDVSETVYDTLGPAGAPHYLGLSPRIAEDVFRVPDSSGRLPVLLDPRTDTVPIGLDGIALQDPDATVRVRQEVVPDLQALQQAAASAGAPFWVVSGLQAPDDSTAARVLPTAFIAPCKMDAPIVSANPPGTPSIAPTPGVTPTPTAAPARVAPQSWLGTVIQVTDDANNPSISGDDTQSQVVQWLDANAWAYGFVPALPESDAGAALGHEPWTWRWVGHPMAAQLQPLVQSGDYATQALAALRQAEREITTQAQADTPSQLNAGVSPASSAP
ncbi:MAG: serine hydrolase [Chloroflexi bacterium]|nr:serine hydrolase [Chloroflexota bacterium]